MNSFLFRIAETYYNQYKSGIGDFTFVFPNRRAGLFFQKYLSEIVERPLFSPEIITINECFLSASGWQQADKLMILFRLYELYQKTSKSGESFDNFVFWGEMLLADFDDVDKHRVDARQLFTNITELKQIDQIFNAFSESQIKAIREFWRNFDPAPAGKVQQDFVSTWKILLPLYEQFRESLLSEGLATEGMIYRDVAERLVAKKIIQQWTGKQFVFIGFNALNPCEKALFTELKKLGQADFYWDYEAKELRDGENLASYFYAENIHYFPSRFDIESVVESLDDKDIELIAVPSEVGQAKEVYSILNRLYPDTEPAKEWIKTAIVLPNENILIPLLHSLPQQIEKINVTMGFPLKATPVSGLVEHVFELQRRKRVAANGTASFYHQTVLNILNHQYIALLCADEVTVLFQKITKNNWIYIDENEFADSKLLSAIFNSKIDTASFIGYLLYVLRRLQEGWGKISDEKNKFRLELDFLYQYYITLNRMSDVVSAKPVGLDMSLDTLMRLIRQLTSGISIPFVGEPLEGLQIMGTLETRGLDFENLVITSFNEGVFPKRSPQNSFIPYNLRKGFDLPTTEHQDSLSAYNFYRLIHRAKRVFFLYDSRTEGIQTGEVSRFAHQLHYHYGVKIRRKSVSFDIGFETPKVLQITKNSVVMEKLQRFLETGENSKALSASSINSYIDCPLQFYLTRVEEMQQIDEVKETVEDNMFGTIFHAVMEYLYEPYKGQIMQSHDFDELIKHTLRIDKEISRAFTIHYFKKKNDSVVPLEGNNLLIAHVIRKYVIQMLRMDKKHAPFRYINSEDRCHIHYPVYGGKRQVNLKGFIDRVDEKEGVVRILDYKTGSGSLDFKSFDEVFEHNNDKRPKYVLQTFLYGILYKDKAAGKQITPGIYYMRDVFKDDFETELHYKSKEKDINEVITDFSVYEEEFREHLTACLEDIFNPDIPFVQSESTKPCQYCPYVGVCNR
ncbi:PD-(D/E)XK nuclease family protein [Paludibacter sp. 221]|uniref:PD-(D/E)XK nuclease family protein n=1 Tax=Paludibacter sp. 221 TaxID=2302939 RepID=UPI0013CF4294|nr:PD-(D/E)XK nuclease family protein [Paludibacter sp. 221]NDV46535.1 PD-(D/E)XK nuclease family protein [Paludibacter sp. 221]